MRNHSEIVRSFSASALARALREKGVSVGASTPQRWRDRNSIPPRYWAVLVELGATSIDELVAGCQIGDVAIKSQAVNNDKREINGSAS